MLMHDSHQVTEFMPGVADADGCTSLNDLIPGILVQNSDVSFLILITMKKIRSLVEFKKGPIS